MGYDDRVDNRQTTVRFGGLNSRENEMSIRDNQASDSLNVELFPLGSARKRRGFRVMTQADGETADTPGVIPDPASSIIAADGLAYLPQYMAGRAYLVTARSGVVWQRRLASGEVWLNGQFPVVSGSTIKSAVGRFYTGDEYVEEALFCATGNSEPFIITGVDSDSWWGSEDNAIVTMTGAAEGAAVSMEATAHGLVSGDVIYFDGITEADWITLNNNSYRVEFIDVDNFYLLDATLARVVATSGVWATEASPVGTFDSGLLGVKRWLHDNWSNPDNAFSSLTGGVVGTVFVLGAIAHGLISGQTIHIHGIQESGWLELNGGDFRIETVDDDSFYLWDDEGERKVTTGTWANEAAPDALDLWDSGPSGYPARWHDPNGVHTKEEWPGADIQDWPKGIAIFGTGMEMRSFAWGFDLDASRVDHSSLGDPTDYQSFTASAADPGFFYAARGDGDVVTLVDKLYGTIIVCKKRKILLYSGTIGDTLAEVAELPGGNVNEHSGGKVGKDFYYWDPVHGPKRLSAVDQYGDIAPSDMADDIPDELNDVTTGQENQIRFVHDRPNRRVIWFAPTGGATTCNKAFAFYYLSNEWCIFSGNYTEISGVVITQGAAGEGELVYASRLNGEIVNQGIGFYDGLDYAGDEVGITSRYATKWFKKPELGYKVRMMWADVVAGSDGLGDAAIEIAYDFEENFRIAGEIERTFGVQGANWGYGLWGTMLWGQQGRSMVRMNFSDMGNLFRLRISDSGTRPWQVHLMNLEVSAKGKR